MQRFFTGRGGYSGGHGGFLVRCRMRVAASAERTVVSSIGIANRRTHFLNLNARGPVRGWVLFGGHLGDRSETTSDSDREWFYPM